MNAPAYGQNNFLHLSPNEHIVAKGKDDFHIRLRNNVPWLVGKDIKLMLVQERSAILLKDEQGLTVASVHGGKEDSLNIFNETRERQFIVSRRAGMYTILTGGKRLLYKVKVGQSSFSIFDKDAALLLAGAHRSGSFKAADAEGNEVLEIRRARNAWDASALALPLNIPDRVLIAAAMCSGL